MGITKGDDTSAVMDCAWEVEKVITVHIGSKIGPANAVGIDVRDQENCGRIINLRDFLWSKPIGHWNVWTWKTFPAEKIVHRITSNTRIVSTSVTDTRRIARTHIDPAGADVMGVEGPLWIEDPI